MVRNWPNWRLYAIGSHIPILEYVFWCRADNVGGSDANKDASKKPKCRTSELKCASSGVQAGAVYIIGSNSLPCL